MNYFEAKKNYRFLKDFRSKLINYFEEEKKCWYDEHLPEFTPSDEFNKIRSKINRLIPKLHNIMDKVGQTYSIQIGSVYLSIFSNLSKRYDFDIDEGVYFDFLDRTLGRYDMIIKKLKWRLIDPFYLIVEFIILKFIKYWIEIFGGNYSKIANRLGEKIIRNIAYLASIIGCIYTIYIYYVK